MNCDLTLNTSLHPVACALAWQTNPTPTGSIWNSWISSFFFFFLSSFLAFVIAMVTAGDGFGSHSQLGERLQHVALNNVWGENHCAFAPPAQRFCILDRLPGVLRPLIRVSFFKSRMWTMKEAARHSEVPFKTGRPLVMCLPVNKLPNAWAKTEEYPSVMSQRGSKTSSRIVTMPASLPTSQSLAPPPLRLPCFGSNRASLTVGRKLKLSVLAAGCQQRAKKCCSSQSGMRNEDVQMGRIWDLLSEFTVLAGKKKFKVTPATKRVFVFFGVFFFQFFYCRVFLLCLHQ